MMIKAENKMRGACVSLLALLACALAGCMTMMPPAPPQPTFAEWKRDARLQARMAQMSREQALQTILKTIAMQAPIKYSRGMQWKISESMPRQGAGWASMAGAIFDIRKIEKELRERDANKTWNVPVNATSNAVSWYWDDMCRVGNVFTNVPLAYKLRYPAVGNLQIDVAPLKDGFGISAVRVFQADYKNDVTNLTVEAKGLFGLSQKVSADVVYAPNPILFEFPGRSSGETSGSANGRIECFPGLVDFLAALAILCPQITDLPMFETSTVYYFPGRTAPEPKALGGSEEKMLLAVLNGRRADGFYVAPDIPDKKLQNASAACQLPADERVLGLIDATRFGNAKNCLLFCLKGLYFNQDWTAGCRGRQFCPYDDFTHLSIAPDGLFDIKIGSILFKTADVDMGCDALIKLLKDVRNTVRSMSANNE